MAKYDRKAAGKLAETAKESAMLRTLRIDGSQNGATLRTKVVRDKTKYNRNVKHKKSLADARDFAFYSPNCSYLLKPNCLMHSWNSL
jgi:hypothetical protein